MEQVLFSFSVRIIKPNDCLSIIKANSIFKILSTPISVNTMVCIFIIGSLSFHMPSALTHGEGIFSFVFTILWELLNL